VLSVCCENLFIKVMGVFRGIDGYLGLLLFEIRRFEEEFCIPWFRHELCYQYVVKTLFDKIFIGR
jgi:hypothetical protein